MTIQEAWKRILEIRGERVSCFTIEFWHHSSGEETVNVTLWDDKRHHYAKNLEGIIKLAEVSMGKPGIVDGELPEQTDQPEKG